jgi:hypothetical protein
LEHENFQPAPDEIEAVAWLDLEEALASVSFYEGLRERLRQLSATP